MSKIRNFNKLPQSYTALIDVLKARGLDITDVELAQHHLKNIGYYRLVGYGLPFELRNEQGVRQGSYVANTNMDTLIDVYIADRRIRILLLSAIERIEVAVRNTINHELARKYNDGHWYLNRSLFKESDGFSHSGFISEIKRNTQKNAEAGSDREGKREVFIHHYYSQYDNPEYPPCWMVAEILALGSWSKVFEHLQVSNDRKIISRQFDLSPATLQSWLHTITYLRNLCAHHSRLFGRNFVIRPSQSKEMPAIIGNKLFNYVCIVFRMLKTISPETKWLDELYDQLDLLDEVLLEQYGFIPQWLEHPFWLDQ